MNEMAACIDRKIGKNIDRMHASVREFDFDANFQ